MRYYHESSIIKTNYYSKTYICNHPIYNRCSLYLVRNKGLSVIQQRYDPTTKHTYWEELDSGLADDIYLQPGFMSYFEKFARGKNSKNLYPTVTVRQIMWALRMKPLKREPWETVFDNAPQ